MDEFKTREAVEAFMADPVMTHAKWVQWAIACAEHTLHLFEDKHTGDARPRQALDAAREWLRSPTTKAAYAAAYAANAAAYAADAANAAAYAAYAADAADAARAKGEQWQVIRLLSVYHGEEQA